MKKVAKLTLTYGHNVLDIVNIEVQCENSLLLASLILFTGIFLLYFYSLSLPCGIFKIINIRVISSRSQNCTGATKILEFLGENCTLTIKRNHLILLFQNLQMFIVANVL